MRAWLEQPHGRRHKAPPQPCVLTTSREAMIVNRVPFLSALRSMKFGSSCALGFFAFGFNARRAGDSAGAARAAELQAPDSTHERRRSHRDSRSTHAAAAAAAATGQHRARARHPARRARRAHPHSTAAEVVPPDPKSTRHHARTTTRDDEKMLRAHMGTKPKTPIDGARRNLVVAPATGARCARGPLPFSSHASVA